MSCLSLRAKLVVSNYSHRSIREANSNYLPRHSPPEKSEKQITPIFAREYSNQEEDQSGNPEESRRMRHTHS